MKRLRVSGLVLLAAATLLAACANVTRSDAPAAMRSFASRPLLRLASYENGSKADIVAHVDIDPADTGRHLSLDDRVAKVTALWHAINDGKVGRQVAWSNAGTGSHGYAEIMREVPIPESDRVCREYREAFVVAGRGETDVGQACQLRDGGWWKIQG
jgi:surface antigen